MTKPSHIPVFPDAYLRDNFRLTLEQHGLFLMLIFEAWNSEDCSLPDDEKALAGILQITPAKFRKIAGPVISQWTRENGRIFQKRLRKEWEYVREKSAKARASVALRKDRVGNYERTTNVGTNDLHLGEGEGEGGGPFQASSSSADIGEKPFRVIGGGK
jgi:uncharacterized protein YdaU (DUF1376 family)